MHPPDITEMTCKLPENSGSSLGNEAEDWRHWCRLCAKDDVQGNISVFFKDEQPVVGGPATIVGSNNGELGLTAAIEKLFWVKIKRSDVLPEMLCTECFSLVTSMVNFAERVSKVQKMFNALHSSSGKTKSDLHAARLKYGLLDEDREHVLTQQPLPEVHYFEEKPKINELEENLFETDQTIANPLEQPRIRLKIKKEKVIQGETDEEDNEDDDPFNGEDADDCEDEEFQPIKTSERDSSSEDDQEEEELNKSLKNIKMELSNLQADNNHREPPKKRVRRTHKFSLDNNERSAGNTNADINSRRSYPHVAGDIFSCVDCPRIFKRVQHFRQHMKRTHSKLEPLHELPCPQCARVFTTQYQLEKHSKVHLPLELKKVIPCPYCDKKFSSNTLVETHIKHIHMNERPFICEECGVAVRTNAALKTHMLTHTDYAPFECEVCKKGFKNQVRLKNHMETHDPNKHICAECGLQLNSRATLNRHLLVHSDEMQHKCDYCGRAFKRAKALKNHLILHTGLKPYSCDFCDRTFANGSNCRSHKKKAHPEELAALEATGGGKTYTRNIPKLEALKAVTKAADNLAPVVSKQSGRFAFGKKPKPPPKDVNVKPTKSNKQTMAPMTTVTNMPGHLNSLHASVPPSTPTGALSNITSIPNIDNIYSHIMKQATMAAAQSANTMETHESPGPPITVHIKRSPSQASSCVNTDHEATSDVPHLQLPQQHIHLLQQQQMQSQPPTPTAATIAPAAQHFYTQIVKQTNVSLDQQLAASHQQQQQHQALLSQAHQQQQHEENSSMRSPDSQASHITDDHSNASATHFYNHIRQNIQGPYM